MEQRGRIILTSWSANGIPGPATNNRADFLWYLALLCLLYDDVLIPDEQLVVGAKLPQWFAKEPGPFLRLLETGGLRVLTQAERAYLDDDLLELSRSEPLAARAEHIQRHLTHGPRPFQPRPRQRVLYQQLDGVLAANPESSEAVSAGSDIWETFATQFRSVLVDSRDWWRGTYPGLTLRTVDQYVGFIDDRARALARIKDIVGAPLPIIDRDGRIAFNRSFGERIASTYPRAESVALIELIESTFAAVFTDREFAAGTYGPGLREIILAPSQPKLQPDSVDAPVIVEALPSLSLRLPITPGVRVMDAVARVRADPAGVELRRVVRDAGSDPGFVAQRAAWLAVAERLAEELDERSASPKRTIRLRPVTVELGGSLLGGAFVEGLVHGVAAVMNPELALAIGATQLVQVTGRLSLSWLRHFYRQADMRQRLEQNVVFRTARIAIAANSVPGPAEVGHK
jgi:hypothetical protein